MKSLLLLVTAMGLVLGWADEAYNYMRRHDQNCYPQCLQPCPYCEPPIFSCWYCYIQRSSLSEKTTSTPVGPIKSPNDHNACYPQCLQPCYSCVPPILTCHHCLSPNTSIPVLSTPPPTTIPTPSTLPTPQPSPVIKIECYPQCLNPCFVCSPPIPPCWYCLPPSPTRAPVDFPNRPPTPPLALTPLPPPTPPPAPVPPPTKPPEIPPILTPAHPPTWPLSPPHRWPPAPPPPIQNICYPQCLNPCYVCNPPVPPCWQCLPSIPPTTISIPPASSWPPSQSPLSPSLPSPPRNSTCYKECPGRQPCWSCEPSCQYCGNPSPDQRHTVVAGCGYPGCSGRTTPCCQTMSTVECIQCPPTRQGVACSCVLDWPVCWSCSPPTISCWYC